MAHTISKSETLKTAEIVSIVQKLSLTKNIKGVMRIVRKAARELTGADGATFVLRDGDLCYYADEDAISPLWKGGRFPMKNCISGWVMLNKKPVLIRDIYKDKRIPIDAYRPTFVKSLAMVPIRTINPIGAIGNYWAKHHQPTKGEMSILQALADVTAVSIQNIEIQNKLEDKLTERTKMLSQLTKQKEQLEDFTHVIAHNMRAPLSNLLLLNDMVKEANDIDEKLLYIEKQKPVIDTLHQTFEELVDAIHVNMDFSISRDYIEFEDCVSKTIELLQGEIIKTKANITSDFSKAKTAYFPKKYMDSIIFNLMSNAIKYSRKDCLPEIKIRSYKKTGWTFIEVKDNGLGIDLKKYGDKVFMLRKTFHHHPQAKGFGLFITKAHVDAMGGNISVKSSPGKGSTFTVQLNKNK